MPKKQKTAIIAPLGLSPPVITAGTDSAGFRVSDLVIIATKDPAVLAGLDLIRVGMSIRAPKVQIREEILPFDDVTTTEENLTFMERVTKIIREERVDAGCDRILLNVAGGRKNMCITLALIGQLMNADGIFHIGNRSISLFNQNLERLRDDIGRIYAAKSFDGKQAIYREKEKEFNHLLFPPKNEYDLVKLPTFPVDQDYVSSLLIALRENPGALSRSEKVILERHGILEKGKSHYYISDYGQRFLDVFI